MVWKSTNSGRPLLSDLKKKHIKEYRTSLGQLIKKMRTSRGLRQYDLGAPSQIRRIEKGCTSRSGVIDVFVKMLPCPKEIAAWILIVINIIETECRNCSDDCKGCSFNKDDLKKLILDE